MHRFVRKVYLFRALSQSQSSSILGIALTGMGGTTIEWYDYFLYGTCVFGFVVRPRT